jgi:hypothetical protein
MDAKTRVQEVIDKLEQYKEIAGNARVYVHGDCQDKNYELTEIGWDPFKRKIVIKIWELSYGMRDAKIAHSTKRYAPDKEKC